MKRSGKREIRDQRILKVLHEFLAARVASGLLERELAADPSFLSRNQLRQRVAIDLRNHLEATYMVRMFAEFEAGLRDVWQNAWNRQTEPPMRDLIDAVAAKRLIDPESHELAHLVRLYRNLLSTVGIRTP